MFEAGSSPLCDACGTVVLLLAVFKVYGLEQPAFFSLSSLMFGGFAVSYWLPFRFKQIFLVTLSLGGAFALLGPRSQAC